MPGSLTPRHKGTVCGDDEYAPINLGTLYRLAKMRLRDVVAMPECRDEISQLVDVVQAAMRLGE